MSVKYSLRSWAIASGPIDSAIAVKPRMSLKSTVVGRRSPPSRTAPACWAISAATLGAKYRSKFERTIASRRTLLGVPAVLDADGRDAAERDQELEILVAEGVRGA